MAQRRLSMSCNVGSYELCWYRGLLPVQGFRSDPPSFLLFLTLSLHPRHSIHVPITDDCNRYCMRYTKTWDPPYCSQHPSPSLWVLFQKLVLAPFFSDFFRATGLCRLPTQAAENVRAFTSDPPVPNACPQHTHALTLTQRAVFSQ